MKIVVIGGGSIGSKLVTRLRQHGHETVAAAPDPGAYALVNAAVVIDVASPPSAEAGAALEFFETSTRTLLAAEAAAGVGHHVVLSAVGRALCRIPTRKRPIGADSRCSTTSPAGRSPVIPTPSSRRTDAPCRGRRTRTGSPNGSRGTRVRR